MGMASAAAPITDKEGELMARLLSVAPENMAEDEQHIARGYRSGWKTLMVAAAIMFGTAHFATEIKWVVAVGFVLVVAVIIEAEGRLYDLCIRLKRTNSLIQDSTTTPKESSC